MHVGDFIEGKAAIDDRFKRAAFQALQHIRYSRLAARGVAAREPDIVCFDGDHLGDHLQYRQSSRTFGEGTVDIGDALERQCRNQLREIRATHRVERLALL